MADGLHEQMEARLQRATVLRRSNERPPRRESPHRQLLVAADSEALHYKDRVRVFLQHDIWLKEEYSVFHSMHG